MNLNQSVVLKKIEFHARKSIEKYFCFLYPCMEVLVAHLKVLVETVSLIK